VLDFTSSLYLGLRHASSSLRPWAQLTTGMPAALAEPPQAQTIAAELARLIGTERATLARSTLHAFWDLFGTQADEEMAIYVDANAYPIARWGAERAGARGALVRTFPHHDPSALWQRLHVERRPRGQLLALADGVCPTCGPAPVRDYLEVVREVGGQLVLDDTQALGILGHSPGPDTPYGRGGGGSLRWHQIGAADVIVVNSLAKGFGVPMTPFACDWSGWCVGSATV
jgi:8-amino-7-oxononanoate synthase